MLSSYRGDLMQTPGVESMRPPGQEPVQPTSVESVQPPSVESVQPSCVKSVLPPSFESVQSPSVESVQPSSVKTQKQMSSRYLCIGTHTLETTFFTHSVLMWILNDFGSIANFQSKYMYI